MRSEAEIRQAVTELHTLIEQYRAEGRRAPLTSGEAGAAYVEAMYCSAALHALQWAASDVPELLLARGKVLLR